MDASINLSSFGFTTNGLLWLGATVFCLVMFVRIPKDQNVRTSRAMFWAALAGAIFTFPWWSGMVSH